MRKGRCSHLFFSFSPLTLHSFTQIPLNVSLNKKCMKSIKAYGMGVYFLVPNSKALGLEVEKLKGKLDVRTF